MDPRDQDCDVPTLSRFVKAMAEQRFHFRSMFAADAFRHQTQQRAVSVHLPTVALA
jgi:hypothetical protein